MASWKLREWDTPTLSEDGYGLTVGEPGMPWKYKSDEWVGDYRPLRCPDCHGAGEIPKMNLRPYQHDAVNRSWALLIASTSCLCVAPTGTGKAILMAAIASRWVEEERGNVLILCHFRELIQQAADKLQRWSGIQAQIEMNTQKADRARMYNRNQIVVGSVPTMRGRRLERWPENTFNLIISDECFPAGTMIDGRPIEQIRNGDVVSAFDQHANAFCKRQVTHVFKRKAPPELILIRSSGRTVHCTRNHPILTDGGWCHAGSIQPGRYVAMESQNDTQLHDLSEGLRANENTTGHMERNRTAAMLLLQGLQPSVPSKHVVSTHGDNKSQVRIGANESQKPNAPGRNSGQGVAVNEGKSADEPWRQRETTSTTTANVGERFRVANGISSPNENATRERLPVELQTGYCGAGLEDRNRGRRRLAQTACETISGSEEGRTLAWTRVDSVEVLKPGRDGTFGGVCPDGFVYNLEVADLHTYVANGFVVHNCHHSPAKSWNAIFKHFDQATRWGCTATPFRKDKQKILKGGAFNELAFEMQLPAAISQGWLVPIRQRYVRIEAIRWDRIKIDTKRDFTDEEVATVMNRDEVVRPAVDQMFAHAGSRPTIVFCATVEHAKHVSEVMNAVRPGCASYVASYKIMDDGRKVTYPAEHREADVAAFKANRKQFMVNVGIFLEGADIPNCACVAHLVGTKSLGKVMQSVGRGTRTLPPELVNAGETDDDRKRLIAGSAKPDLLVLDFVGISGQHKLIYTPAMLMPTGLPLAVKQAFQRKVDKAGGVEDAERILAECKAEVLARIERIQQIRNGLSARTEVTVEDVDPFGTNHVPYAPPKPSVEGPTEAMAEYCHKLVSQVARLKSKPPAFSLAEIRAMPRKKVSGLIGSFKGQRDGGPPTSKQAQALRNMGMPVPATFTAATKLLDQMKQGATL